MLSQKSSLNFWMKELWALYIYIKLIYYINNIYIYNFIFFILYIIYNNIYIYIYIYIIMNTMCPSSYHHNGFVATHALGHMMYGWCTWVHNGHITEHHVPKCMSCHKAIVMITSRAHCFHNNIYYAHLASVRF